MLLAGLWAGQGPWAGHAQPGPPAGHAVAQEGTSTARQRAQVQHAFMREHPLYNGSGLVAAWTPLGPGAVLSSTYGALGGRITSLALDPNDTTGNTAYVGTAGGGVWKSTNVAGQRNSITFTPLTDTLPVFAATSTGSTVPSLSIGAVAVQPAANGVVLAGTGDPNNANSSLYGEGLLRSTDGGLTWTLLTGSNDGANGEHSFAGLATAGLAWSSTTHSLVVAAMSLSPESSIVSASTSQSVAGLYYSTDSGTTWHMASLYDGAHPVQQPSIGVTAGNAATAVVWDASRNSFFAAVQYHGYYASADGQTWTRLATQPGTNLTAANCPSNPGGTGSASCPLFRGALAVQPVTGDLYALTVDTNNSDQGLWQDLCIANANGACTSAAPTWGKRIDAGALDTAGSATIPQGTYALSLSATPTSTSGTLLLAGTQDVYRCELSTASPSTCTWRNTTNSSDGCATPAGVAPAQHAFATMLVNGAPFVLAGNDSGLWRSVDGIAQTGTACNAGDAAHFDNLNTALASAGSLAEVTGFAQDSSNANTLLVSLLNSGTAGTVASATLWPQLATGEGSAPLLDVNAPSHWLVSIASGVNLKLCTNGSQCAAKDFSAPATIGPAQTGNDVSLIAPPVLLDPALTSNLLTATCRVWRGPAANTPAWSAANALSPAFDGSATPCSSTSALVRSLAAGGPSVLSSNLQASGSTVLYAGMAGALSGGGARLGGHLFVTRNAATALPSWSDVALSPVTNVLGGVFNPGAYDISSLVIDPHDATGATVYATVMGFGQNSAVPHLYRSTDFGAHWTTVSANLPDAPANAVAIDPNDANTVYIATDAGVYATQAIGTCATQSCWSVFGTGLPNAPVTSLQAAPTLPTTDGRTGLLRAGTDGRGLWQVPLLTATGAAQAAFTLSAASLNFAAQATGTQSAAQTVTFTSTGNAPLVFGTPAITGDFFESDTCAGNTIAVGGTCSFAVQFAPSSTGTRSGLLTVYANISGGQATVALTGSGTAPAAIVLTPSAVLFPATTLNATAPPQIISVANTGSTIATFTNIAASGDFHIAANTCGATLAPQNACAVSIAFTPIASGTRNGTLALTDSAGTQTALLSGTGQSTATDTLAPSAVTFAQQAIGTTSATQAVTLTNAGDQPLLQLSVATTGDFTATNGCGSVLAAHASCVIGIQFVPTATGGRAGTLLFSDAFRTQSVALSGTGVAPAGVSLTPVAVDFGTMGVGLSSAAQTVTLTNNGGLPLHIGSSAVTGSFVLAANTCGVTVAINTACTLQLVFAPAAAGPVQGALTLVDDAPSHTQTVALTGSGVDFTLVPTAGSSTMIASGTTATFPLQLTSLPSLSGNVALACTGAPAHSLCTVSPAVAPLGTTVNITVAVQTGLAHAELHGFPLSRRTDLTLLALALPCVLRPRRTLRASCVLLFSLCLVFSGCSTSRLIPGDGSAVATPTPSGTYSLQVTATAAGITHTVPLTLIVQ